VRYAGGRGKPLFLSQVGTAYYGGPRGDRFGPSTHEAFLTEAELIVRCIGAGAAAFSRYCFLNPGDIDGVWQLIDTADGSYRRRENAFYGYANLCRYVRPHSVALAVSASGRPAPYERVHACAVKKPTGEITVLAVNDDASEVAAVEIRFPPEFAGRRLRRVHTSRTAKHEAGPEFILKGRAPGLSDEIAPMSLAAYTDIPYDPLSR
jgi:hypothetical protein